MAHGDIKDLARRTASDKVLCDKAFNVALVLYNMMDINMESPHWFIHFSIKSLPMVLLKVKLCETNN